MDSRNITLCTFYFDLALRHGLVQFPGGMNAPTYELLYHNIGVCSNFPRANLLLFQLNIRSHTESMITFSTKVYTCLLCMFKFWAIEYSL